MRWCTGASPDPNAATGSTRWRSRHRSATARPPGGRHPRDPRRPPASRPARDRCRSSSSRLPHPRGSRRTPRPGCRPAQRTASDFPIPPRSTGVPPRWTAGATAPAEPGQPGPGGGPIRPDAVGDDVTVFEGEAVAIAEPDQVVEDAGIERAVGPHVGPVGLAEARRAGPVGTSCHWSGPAFARISGLSGSNRVHADWTSSNTARARSTAWMGRTGIVRRPRRRR